VKERDREQNKIERLNKQQQQHAKAEIETISQDL
jgi:hypothetical protein